MVNPHHHDGFNDEFDSGEAIYDGDEEDSIYDDKSDVDTDDDFLVYDDRPNDDGDFEDPIYDDQSDKDRDEELDKLIWDVYEDDDALQDQIFDMSQDHDFNHSFQNPTFRIPNLDSYRF